MDNHNKQIETPWWSEDYGFFGSFYMEGDDSNEGYLIEKKQTLEERTQVEVDGVIKLLDAKPGDKILDCPSGYGRHSIELAKKGFRVTGVDLNSAHLEKAREEAEKQGVKVDFTRKSMIDLDYDSQFDHLINMFYSFGFFDSDEENMEVLKRFYNSLKTGGKFLMHTDVNIPRIISGDYKTDETRNLKNGKKLRIIDNYDSETKRINGAWIIIDNDGTEIRRDYSVRVYTKEEFVDMCMVVGFKSCSVYSDWAGEDYTSVSEDMIVVAEK